MNFNEILKAFSEVFGRNGKDIGLIQFNGLNNAATDNLEHFYKIINFENTLTIGGALFMNIFPKQKLQMAQNGFYLIKTNGGWVNDDKNWNKDWVVFANRNDDGIFIKTNENSIYGTIDKRQYFKLSNSLSKYFQIITECMILEKEKYNFETFDEDEETLAEYTEDARQIIIKMENENIANDFIEFFWG